MYPAAVLRHFENPQHSGELSGADTVVRAENPACGDLMELSLLVGGDGVLQARFRAKGCVASIAAGSALTTLLNGRTLDESRRLQREDILHELDGLTPESMHASHLAFDVWTKALNSLTLASGAKVCI